MKCPVHNEEMRVEYDRNAPPGQRYTTGFCLKCLKHYTRCASTRYMNPCDLVTSHELPHVAANGEMWAT